MSTMNLQSQMENFIEEIRNSGDLIANLQDCFSLVAEEWFRQGWGMNPGAAKELADRLIYNDPR